MQENSFFNNLINKLTDLPGIGKKTAQRLAFYIMKTERAEALSLAEAIINVKEKVKYCSICFNLTEADPCDICSDPKRETSTICVVENPSDLNAVEKSGFYQGVYHVLGGALSPLDNVGPDELHLDELVRRLDSSVKEVIIATNPTVEGEATAVYLADIISKSGMHVTRIARGLPVGSDLEFADKITLTRSFEGRMNMK